MSASYPTSAKSFTPVVNGNTVAETFWNEAYDEITAVETDLLAAWTAPVFSAGNFAGNGSMTWTVGSGDVTTFAYKRIGKTITVAFQLAATTVGGSLNNTLLITIPGGLSAARTMLTAARYTDNGGTAAMGCVFATGGSSQLSIQKADGSNWSAATDATYVQGIITFEVS